LRIDRPFHPKVIDEDKPKPAEWNEKKQKAGNGEWRFGI